MNHEINKVLKYHRSSLFHIYINVMYVTMYIELQCIDALIQAFVTVYNSTVLPYSLCKEINIAAIQVPD